MRAIVTAGLLIMLAFVLIFAGVQAGAAYLVFLAMICMGISYS